MAPLLVRRTGLALWAAAALALGLGPSLGGLFVSRPSRPGAVESLVARRAQNKIRRASDRHGSRPTTERLHRKRYRATKKEKPPTPQQRDQLAYEKALEECIGTKNYKRALNLLDLMAFRGLERRREAWTNAVKTCGKAGRPEEAQQLLRSMRGAGHTPDHHAYHCTVEACKLKGDPKTALSLLREMREEGFPPNGPTYTQVITALVQGGYREEARDLYFEAQEQGMYHVWGKDHRFLDLQELNIPMARVAMRAAIEERSVVQKAGRGGFYVLTGPANKRDAQKQAAILSVIRSEFGLKVRVDPSKFGRVLIKGDQLKRLGLEKEMEYEPEYA